jgi:hypothetical protein
MEIEGDIGSRDCVVGVVIEATHLFMEMRGLWRCEAWRS